MRGIDISNWQSGLKPSALSIDFCICKATEGVDFVDQYCDGFIQDCIDNNILWGFYHFAREWQPEKEAEFFYENCKGYFGKGIPVLDYEVYNDNIKDWCERFIKKVYELSGVYCMVYASASRTIEFYGSWIPEKCGLWVAGYPQAYSDWTEDEMPYSTYPWEFAAIWQFTSSLIIRGFWEKLDGDIAYMDKKAWALYANSTKSGKNAESANEAIKQNAKKTIDDYVRETLNGDYGTGDERKKKLGKLYSKVQKRIDKLYNIADEVLDGKWGNGWNREQALNGAGYPYDIVQGIVNERFSQR